MADLYRAVVASLERVLQRSAAALEAWDLMRRLIETVAVTPLPEHGKSALTVKEQIAAFVVKDGDYNKKLGAGGRSLRARQLLMAPV